MRALLIILMFFVISALLIISNNNLYMIEDKGSSKFLELYGAWLDDVYSNTQTLTGQIVKMEWFPANENEGINEMKDIGGRVVRKGE